MKDKIELIRGSGNVWRDFGFADADIKQAKSIIAARIIGILDDQKISTRQAAKKTGFAAADFSRVRNADFGRFTLDRIIKMLHSLDNEIEIMLTVQNRRHQNHSPEHCEQIR